MTLADRAPLGLYIPVGTGRYLGGPVSNIRPNLLFGIVIDWDNDGAFNGGNEWRWLVPNGLETERGRESFVRSDGTGFERIEVGRCTMTLSNHDGRYDPRNTSSPLYPHLLNKKERDAYIFVKDGDSGDAYDLFTGRLVDFQNISDRRGRKTIKLYIEDTMRYLQRNRASVDIQEAIDTSTAIQAVLDDITWRWGRSLGESLDSIPWWWAFSEPAYDQIMDLADSELGIFYTAADGSAVFLNRAYSDPDPLVLNGNEISPEVIDSHPSEVFRDQILLRLHPRVLQATSVVWTLQDVPLLIANGETITVWPEFTYEGRTVPILNPLIQPTTDYTLFQNDDGTGTDLTAGLSAVYTPLGEGGKLVITNNSGSDGYIIGMQMRGDALDSPDAVQVRTGNGENVMEVDLSMQQKVTSGQNVADVIHTFLSDPDKYFLTISIEGNPEKQFSRDLFRWVDLTVASRSISDLFRISKIKHQLMKRRIMRTTFWLEPTFDFVEINETQLDFQLPARIGEP